MNKLTIVIASKNEAQNILECIKSASFADEIIVLDSGSKDNTVKLASDAGAKVIETDWLGYGIQQNRGIDAAKNEWVFSLDADERITEALAKEITNAISKNTFDVFDIPRKSYFVNTFINHSGWWPDRTKRLFKKGAARFTEHEIHAHLKTTREIGHLNEPMIHYSYLNLESVLEKMNRYSSGSARDMKVRGEKGSLFKAFTHAIWAFLRTYIIRLGFLDGKMGFILAIYNAETTYYRYLKLMLISNNDELN